MNQQPRPRVLAKRAAVSDLLTRVVAIAPADGKMTLDELMKRAGRRGPAFLMLFLCILSMIFSIVPGVSTVIGLPLLLLAWQMMLGRRRLSLPSWLGRRALDYQLLAQGLTGRLALVQRIERLLKPRLRILCTKPFIRLVGFVTIVCSIVLSLPIPLMNFPPTLAVFLMALGVLGRDGLLILSGFVIAALVVVTLILVTLVGLDVFQLLLAWLGL